MTYRAPDDFLPDLELLSPSIGLIIPLGTVGIGPAHRELPVKVPGEGGEAGCLELSAGRGDVSVSRVQTRRVAS